MCKSAIKYLSWDSIFFNKKIGKIDITNLLNLSKLLKLAQQEDYKLIYVFDNKGFFVEENILRQYNGKLVDKKILFEKSLSVISDSPNSVVFYEEFDLTPELENLAYISGEYSRFKRDKNFAENDFYRMYKTWIENSIKHQIAESVFIAKENGLIKGMATLKIDEKVGHIGLLAVSPDTQGKGYGKALIQACENEALTKKITTIEVPTQFDNRQACCFYEKCGFKIKSITDIYHFWL
ncbi:MAG: GNAT family N-acetyltransferase [Prevotellaceae bacterium]|jgi:ribosomal protein S18 acetylase RimI-like enzyme|nr:GNAT family N-acetyltransferase [Prevotellaceae bacterium]